MPFRRQGALATKGIIFTASTFSSEAGAYAATVSPRVIPIDGERLAELMIDYNVGVAAREAYEVKRVDRDYFGDDASLRGGSPKYERTAMRWLERYLSEGLAEPGEARAARPPTPSYLRIEEQ